MARQGTLLHFGSVALFLFLLLCIPAFALPSVALAKPAHITAAPGQSSQNGKPIGSKPEEWAAPRHRTVLTPNMSTTPYQQGGNAGFASKPEEWSSPRSQMLLVPATNQTFYQQGGNNAFTSKPDWWTTSIRLLLFSLIYSGISE